ncbi:hypothetical protein ScPMuIL_006698 [Solemya velum]
MADGKTEDLRHQHKVAVSRSVVIQAPSKSNRSHELDPTGPAHKVSTLSKMLSQTVVNPLPSSFVQTVPMAEPPKTKSRAKTSSEKKPRSKHRKTDSKSQIPKPHGTKGTLHYREVEQPGVIATVPKSGDFSSSQPISVTGFPMRVVTTSQTHISTGSAQLSHGHLLEALSIQENQPLSLQLSSAGGGATVTVQTPHTQATLPPKKSISPTHATAFVDSLGMHRENISLSAIETVPAPNRTIVSSNAWPPHDRTSPRTEHIVSIQHGQGQIVRPSFSIPVREADSSLSGLQRIVRIVAPAIGEAEQEAVSQLHRIIASSTNTLRESPHPHQSSHGLDLSPSQVRVIRTPSPAHVHTDPYSVAAHAQERNKDSEKSQPMNLSVPHGNPNRDISQGQQTHLQRVHPPHHESSVVTEQHPDMHLDRKSSILTSTEVGRTTLQRSQQSETSLSLPFQAYENQRKSPIMMSPYSDSRSSPQPNTLMQHLVTPYFLQRAMEEAKIGGIFPSPPRRVGDELNIYTEKPSASSDSKFESEAKVVTHEPAATSVQKHGRVEKKQSFTHRQTPPSQRQTPPSAFEQRSPGRVIHHYSIPSTVPQTEASKYMTSTSATQQQRQIQPGGDTGVQFIHKPIPSTLSSSNTDIQSNTVTQTIPTISRHSHVSSSHTSSPWNPSTQSHILEAALRKHTNSVQHVTSSNHSVFSSSHYTFPTSSHTTSSPSAASTKAVSKQAPVEPKQTRYSPPPRPGVPHIDPVSVPLGIGPIRQPVVNLARLPDGEFKQEAFPQNSRASRLEIDTDPRPVVNSTQVKSLSPQITLDQTFQSIPPTVNPFTFPKISKFSSARNIPSPFKSVFDNELVNLQSTTISSRAKMSAHTDICRKVSDSSDDMPRLVPEVVVAGENTFNKEIMTAGEWQTMPSPFNMRLQNLANFPSTGYKSTYRTHSVPVHRARIGCITSAAKSLDLLRQNLQKSINRDIQQVIQKYLDKFFKPGIENIKVNNGSNAVSEEHIQTVCIQILEESKKMYSSEGRRSLTPTRDFSEDTSDTAAIMAERVYLRRGQCQTQTLRRVKAHLQKRKKGGHHCIHLGAVHHPKFSSLMNRSAEKDQNGTQKGLI